MEVSNPDGLKCFVIMLCYIGSLEMPPSSGEPARRSTVRGGTGCEEEEEEGEPLIPERQQLPRPFPGAHRARACPAGPPSYGNGSNCRAKFILKS